jgi:MarR family transcriptional regulator, organic hydroperoxide resistance regulator
MNMTTPSTSQHHYWLLLQLAYKTRSDFSHLAEHKYHLTYMQLYVLCLLKPEEPSPMSTLSSLLSCDASNITGITDRLTAGGYIERLDDPADRRIKRIALTASGVHLRTIVLHDLTDFEPATMQNLTEQEQYHLGILLVKALGVKA